MTRMAGIHPGDGDPRHGSLNGYINLRCWCGPCREAGARYRQKLRQRHPPLAPDDPRHGTNNGYTNCGCRCTPCRKAANAARRHYKQTRKALTA